MNKYPIGLQDFGEIRTGGYLYIDKTQLIHTLINSGKYYFLSRPRRFGKSLLLSTIKEIFEGNKQLFEGLWINDQWNWEQRHPVIHIKISKIDYQKFGLYDAINLELDHQAGKFDLTLLSEGIKGKFYELIEKVSAIGKVVILIDEYDKPITDYLDDLGKVAENRAVFKSFYSVLKDADPYIRFMILTGVSRFSKVSIFSDLNNLNDITIHRNYATIAGITQKELEYSFVEEIGEVQKSQPNLLHDLKLWYNGYSWHPDAERVYNPFSILKYMDGRDFENYWFLTGTPTWLVNHMRDKMEYKLEDLHYSGIDLASFNAEQLESIPLLFQTGYLTIKGYDPEMRTYELVYPNREVEESLNDALLNAYRNVNPGSNSNTITAALNKALNANDIPGMIKAIDASIATVPYPLWNSDKESVFNIILYLSFKRMGVYVRTEESTSQGISDLTVETSTHVYIFELKINGSSQKALHQIFEKGYLSPVQVDSRKKIAIRINFSSEKRAVESYAIKEVEN